jgi:ABC-type lipoprotein release transport system permease subunit
MELAFGATRLVASFLNRPSPADAVTLTGAMRLLAAAGPIAAYLPARRAARVNPMNPGD